MRREKSEKRKNEIHLHKVISRSKSVDVNCTKKNFAEFEERFEKIKVFLSMEPKHDLRLVHDQSHRRCDRTHLLMFLLRWQLQNEGKSEKERKERLDDDSTGEQISELLIDFHRFFVHLLSTFRIGFVAHIFSKERERMKKNG